MDMSVIQVYMNIFMEKYMFCDLCKKMMFQQQPFLKT
jgi:hypothetical protein